MTRNPRWTQETEDRLARAILLDRASRWGFNKQLGDELDRWVEVQEHSENVRADIRAMLQELALSGLLLPPGSDEEQLLSMETKNGETTVTIEASRKWMLEVAGYLINLLQGDAGLNYVQWDVKPAGQADPYRMILVRPGGKSPHELRLEAEQDRCDYDCDTCHDER